MLEPKWHLPTYAKVGVPLAAVLGFLLGHSRGSAWSSSLVCSAIAGAAALGFFSLLGWYDLGLARRLRTATPSRWRVTLNGIEVGSISDADYAALQRRAYADPSVAAAQGLNVVKVLANMAGNLVVAVPVMTFWLAALSLWAGAPWPSSVREALRLADPAALGSDLGPLVGCAIALCIVGGLASVLFTGRRFGFRNHFDEEIAGLLRQHFGCAADGVIRLTKIASVSEAALLTNHRNRITS